MRRAAAHGAAVLTMLAACGGEPDAKVLPELPPLTGGEGLSPEAGTPLPRMGAAVDCPPGMLRVRGAGTIGMKGQPYGVIPTRHMAQVDAPERGCPAAIARTEGATACWVQTDLVDPVLQPREVQTPDFCIDRVPFPGAGVSYPVDGMTAGTVALLDELLQTGRFGPRRLCSATEYQLAVAGPTANLRFVYGDHADTGRCKAGQNIGSARGCTNPETGVAEYGAIHSSWVIADQGFVQASCVSPPCTGAGNRPLVVGAYVVMGGTSRVQTRQAPLTPHTWHDHGEPADVGCGDEGWDDQVVICADPDPAYGSPSQALSDADRAWAPVVEAVRRSGRVTAGLAQGLGRMVCPEGSLR